MDIIDGYNFKCKKCGECCKWKGEVKLTPTDIQRISNYLSMEDDNFLNSYTKNKGNKVVLIDKPGTTTCTFLKDNLCSIWNVKPKQCEDYPKKFDKRCPGFEIQDRSSTMSDKYAESVKQVMKKLSSDHKFDQKITEDLYRNLKDNIKAASVVNVAMEEGIDEYLNRNTMKIASLDDLFSFDRIDKDHLIHKCTRDLWSVASDTEGNVQITRLFDNSGEPIRG